MGEPCQFRSVTACKFVHHNQINNEIKERTVLCVYLSKHSKFWAFEAGLCSIDGVYKYLCVRYVFSSACHSKAIEQMAELSDEYFKYNAKERYLDISKLLQ